MSVAHLSRENSQKQLMINENQLNKRQTQTTVGEENESASPPTFHNLKPSKAQLMEQESKNAATSHLR